MLTSSRKPTRLHFTKDALNRIQPPDSGRVYLYDDEARGLALCVTAAGSKSFYFYRKIDGKPERIRLGGWPELTIEQARRASTSYNGKVAEGANPAIVARIRKQAPTLGAVFDLFLELPTRTKSKRPKSAITLRNYRQVWNTCLEDWRNRKLSSISKTDIEKRHNQLGTERGNYMANRALELIRALYNTAIDQDVYTANPAARLRRFEEESRERFLQADELPAFWQALEAEPSEKVKDFVKILLFTGQRRMNCLQMRWEDVNLDRAMWSLPQTKTGRHEVPLTAEAVKILKRRKEAREGECEYVFPGRHGYGHLQDPMRQWRDLLKRAGIENLRLHDLRRSLGSWQAATGASLSIIGKTLGHSRPETTAIYSRLEHTPVRAAMETATAAILAATTPPEPVKKKRATGTKRKGAKRGKA